MGLTILGGSALGSAIDPSELNTGWIRVGSGLIAVAAGATQTLISSLAAHRKYKLVLIGKHAADTAGAAQVQFNADTGANYTRHRSTTGTMAVTTGATGIQILSDSLEWQCNTLEFNAEAGTAHNVTMDHEGRNAAASSEIIHGGTWTSTNAITSIALNVAGSASRTISGYWALYYNKDIGDAA